MEDLLKQYRKWSPLKEREIIKPFATLEEVWLLLHNDEFISKIHSDRKFLIFIRKKLFWILEENKDDVYLMFKRFDVGESDEALISIADQVLLTYFENNLVFLDLCKISSRNDEYNSLRAYSINSKRGSDYKSPLN